MDIIKEVVPLKEAATRMGRSTDQLAASMRYCAMNCLAFPIGFGVPPGNAGGKWAYIIPRKRFERYMSGTDMTAHMTPTNLTPAELRRLVELSEAV